MANDGDMNAGYCTICDKDAVDTFDSACAQCWADHADDLLAQGNSMAAAWAANNARRARRAGLYASAAPAPTSDRFDPPADGGLDQ